MKVNVFGTRGFPLIQGGVEKHCECLYPIFPSEYQLTIFRRKPYVHSQKKYDNIRFIDLPSTKIKGVEAVLHSFLATIYSMIQRPDIVHIHNIGPAIFSPLLKWMGIKLILTYHSPNYEHEKWNLFARTLLRISEKIALNTSDTIIFVNKTQLQKQTPEIQKKSYYIPNGINPAKFTDKTDFLESLGLEKEKYILAVGRITPEKGFDYLIKAFENAETKDYKLVIAGGVETENSYLAKLKNNRIPEQIVFAGYTFGENLAQLYSHAALFVLPSYNEGFSMVVLEAMSYHLELLVSDIPANKAIDLDENVYFRVGDEVQLTARLKEIMGKPLHRIQYSIENYQWDMIAEQTMDVIKNNTINRFPFSQFKTLLYFCMLIEFFI
ncbi:glycosyl transferase [Bacteroidia bacterium]|nr:glycosyl transferase [Bacteroidia bacterium]